jgi:hypothetical protein
MATLGALTKTYSSSAGLAETPFGPTTMDSMRALASASFFSQCSRSWVPRVYLAIASSSLIWPRSSP